MSPGKLEASLDWEGGQWLLGVSGEPEAREWMPREGLREQGQGLGFSAIRGQRQG